MNYKETLEFLFTSAPMYQNIGAGAYKEGLTTTQLLDSHFSHPHRSYVTLHIGGTNGKGTTSHTLAAILQSAGFKVGLYTSPHLMDFRERIRVNGVPIPKERVVEFVAEERSFFEPLSPSFFELTTILAFKYFEEEKIDIAVVEVGLGGRLDCTNILNPILSVITNISLDHTQFLGKTLPEIAAEKAGIVKLETPVVIGQSLPETRPIFLQKAKELHSPIYFAQEECPILSYRSNDLGEMIYQTADYGEIISPLGGSYQFFNTTTILSALQHLPSFISQRISRSAVHEGFAQVTTLTGLKGRWQCLQKSPRIVCDTGHNADAWKYLSQQIKSITCQRLHLILGVCTDKDIDAILQQLPTDASYYFTQPSVERALSCELLQIQARAYGLHGTAYSSVRLAYDAALQDAGPNDFIFVGGSSFIVANLLSSLSLEL